MNASHHDANKKDTPNQYEPPRLQKIDLTPDETLVAGCKTDTFGDCLQVTGPTFEYGS